jgi:cyclic di-GMP phosphodiesterase Gmr
MVFTDSETQSPDLFVVFGTNSPLWKLSDDSAALQLSGTEDGVAMSVTLDNDQEDAIRGLSGFTSALTLELLIMGCMTKLHLVGRKIDLNTWAGKAALFGDTETVARSLEASLSFAEQIVSDVNSLVIILDSKGRIKRFNRRCELVTGMKEADLVGKNAHDLFIPEDVKTESRTAIARNFTTQSSYEVIRKINTHSGVRLIHWRNTHMQSGSGIAETYLVCSGTDITDEHEAKERLFELANKDVLTGLPNRHAVEELISRMTDDDVASPFGIIFLDLDQFKKINDHYGHVTGDALLKKVAEALSGCMEKGDTIARLGGDEFLIVVNQPKQLAVEALGLRVLDAMKKPFSLKRAEVYTGCSIGIAMYPHHGKNLEELVRSADTAMYAAKESGRGTYRVFAEEMDNKVSQYIWLESNLRRALDENQFELYYQPKVSLLTGQMESVEALLRWNHPVRGMVNPNEFIPYAEESGLIVPLGKWVMEAGARQAGIWKKQGLNIRVAINISARQLKSPAILEDFTHAVLSNDLSPSMVDLELTESCLIDDEHLAHRLIRLFRELGAQVHLDDFGTGYSSLSHLARLPLDVLKLDGSFITSINRDAKSRALVRSMVAVGHELNLKIVAECVETAEQADFLRAIGVDYAQGYFYAKPMTIDDLERSFDLTTKQRLSVVPSRQPMATQFVH